jgi:hypothetical protein
MQKKEAEQFVQSVEFEFTMAQERLALALFDVGAIKFGDFRLRLHEENPDAPLSPVYLDLKVLRRFPDAKEAAVDAY